MDAIKELEALLDYLIHHNEDHAAEVAELAEKAKALGKEAAFEKLMNGVEKMKTANASLQEGLDLVRG